MKKKGMALGALLMAVAITGYSVSGTYAKYISSVDLTDEARVAKWGFNENIDIDLFSSSYSIDGNHYVQAFQNEDGTIDNVVAPGTTGTSEVALEGEMETRFVLSFDLLNENDFVVYYTTKEVDGKTVVDKKSLTKDDAVFDGVTPKEYHPLRYTIEYNKADGTNVFKLEDADFDTLKTNLDTYNANNWTDKENGVANLKHTLTPQKLDRRINITWKWATRNTTDGKGNNLTEDQVDDLDTFAGQNLSKHTDVAKFGIKVTAEQIAQDYAE